MIKYKIGNEYLDQFDKDSSFAISKAISKVGEINLRHGDRSTGFKVPLTSKNTKLLNYITILNSSTTNDSFKKIIGQLVEEETVISEGYFQVTKYNPYKKEVDLRFYGGNTDWFSDIKDTAINENSLNYDTTEFDLFTNAENIRLNFLEDIRTTPYKYFLVDNNKDWFRNKTNETTIETSVSDYQVGFSQGYIFDKILKSVGIKVNGNIFNDPKFYNTLVLQPNDLSKIVEVSKIDDAFNFGVKKIYGQPTPSRQIPYDQGGTKSTILFDSGNTVNEWDGTSFTFQGIASSATFEYYLRCTFLSFGAPLEVKLDMYFNDALVDSNVPMTTSPTDNGNHRYTRVFTNLKEGDNIRFEFNRNAPNSRWVGVTSSSNLKVVTDGYVSRTLGSNLLPSIPKDKFVKDTLVQFGAITQYDSKTKTLTCNKLSIVDDNRIFAPDWSSKIDLTKPPTVNLTSLLSNYSKKSYFKYSEYDDSDHINALYEKITNYRLGDGAIIIDNSFLTDEKDFYESPYAPTDTTFTFPYSVADQESYQTGNLYIPFIPLYKLTGEDDLGNPVYDDNELNPRKVLFVSDIALSSYRGNCNSITIEGNSSISVMPLVYFDKTFYNDKLDDYKETLSFGLLEYLSQNTYGYGLEKNTILDENYIFQNKILNKPIFLEINMMLTPIDVQTVDFFTPIWLDFGLDSGYYYIDEISQYKGQDKATRVNLVKI